MRQPILSAALSLFALHAVAQQPAPPLPDAASIMARVAANQDQSEAARAHFVYIQHADVASRKGRTVRCQELTESRVTPTDTGSQQAILKLDGRLLVKGKYVTYTNIPPDKKPAAAGDEELTLNLDDDNTDRDLVENMRKNLTNSKSRDGIGAHLFPLTTKSQADYDFTLLGREQLNGRDVFHLRFTFKDKSDYGWKGDAYIDSTAYEPVVIRTAMSRKIPFAVRTLLGTSLPGLGFTVVYAPQKNGDAPVVWFPVSFGTEFKIKVLFFFNREIVLSAQNRDFELTHVTSTIIPTQ